MIKCSCSCVVPHSHAIHNGKPVVKNKSHDSLFSHSSWLVILNRFRWSVNAKTNERVKNYMTEQSRDQWKKLLHMQHLPLAEQCKPQRLTFIGIIHICLAILCNSAKEGSFAYVTTAPNVRNFVQLFIEVGPWWYVTVYMYGSHIRGAFTALCLP